MRYFNHLLTLPGTTITKQAFIMSKSLCDNKKPSYHTHLQEMLSLYEIKHDLKIPFPALENFNTKTKTTYFHKWKKHIAESKKLEVYKLIKTDYEEENYLSQLRNFEERKTFTKFRISNHKLAIETGRYRKQNMQRNQRLCVFCNLKETESEKHMFTHCPLYRDLRLTLYEKAGPGV